MTPALIEDETNLARQARRFHAAFFAAPAPEDLVRQYTAASRACFPEIEPAAAGQLERIVASGWDVEAIELALRSRGGGALLTRKIQILFYLAECRSAYLGVFLSREGGRARAAWGIARAVLRTAVKFIQGRFLVWKHDLV